MPLDKPEHLSLKDPYTSIIISKQFHDKTILYYGESFIRKWTKLELPNTWS